MFLELNEEEDLSELIDLFFKNEEFNASEDFPQTNSDIFWEDNMISPPNILQCDEDDSLHTFIKSTRSNDEPQDFKRFIEDSDSQDVTSGTEGNVKAWSHQPIQEATTEVGLPQIIISERSNALLKNLFISHGATDLQNAISSSSITTGSQSGSCSQILERMHHNTELYPSYVSRSCPTSFQSDDIDPLLTSFEEVLSKPKTSDDISTRNLSDQCKTTQEACQYINQLTLSRKRNAETLVWLTVDEALPLSESPEDGFNWRKYGSKMAKGKNEDVPMRCCYYSCCKSEKYDKIQCCPARKKVYRYVDCEDPLILKKFKVVYKGEHNH